MAISINESTRIVSIDKKGMTELLARALSKGNDPSRKAIGGGFLFRKIIGAAGGPKYPIEGDIRAPNRALCNLVDTLIKTAENPDKAKKKAVELRNAHPRLVDAGKYGLGIAERLGGAPGAAAQAARKVGEQIDKFEGYELGENPKYELSLRIATILHAEIQAKNASEKILTPETAQWLSMDVISAKEIPCMLGQFVTGELVALDALGGGRPVFKNPAYESPWQTSAIYKPRS